MTFETKMTMLGAGAGAVVYGAATYASQAVSYAGNTFSVITKALPVTNYLGDCVAQLGKGLPGAGVAAGLVGGTLATRALFQAVFNFTGSHLPKNWQDRWYNSHAARFATAAVISTLAIATTLYVAKVAFAITLTKTAIVFASSGPAVMFVIDVAKYLKPTQKKTDPVKELENKINDLKKERNILGSKDKASLTTEENEKITKIDKELHELKGKLIQTKFAALDSILEFVTALNIDYRKDQSDMHLSFVSIEMQMFKSAFTAFKEEFNTGFKDLSWEHKNIIENNDISTYVTDNHEGIKDLVGEINKISNEISEIQKSLKETKGK